MNRQQRQNMMPKIQSDDLNLEVVRHEAAGNLQVKQLKRKAAKLGYQLVQAPAT